MTVTEYFEFTDRVIGLVFVLTVGAYALAAYTEYRTAARLLAVIAAGLGIVYTWNAIQELQELVQ